MRLLVTILWVLLLAAGCAGRPAMEQSCTLASRSPDAALPPHLGTLGCFEDFAAISSAFAPGVDTVLVVLDRAHDDRLYFGDSDRVTAPEEFVDIYLPDTAGEVLHDSDGQRPVLYAMLIWVAPLGRFALELPPGAATTADVAMELLAAVKRKTFLGDELAWLTDSDAQRDEAEARGVPFADTAVLFAHIPPHTLVPGDALGVVTVVGPDELVPAMQDHPRLLVLTRLPEGPVHAEGVVATFIQTPLHLVTLVGDGPIATVTDIEGQARVLDGSWARLAIGDDGVSLSALTEQELACISMQTGNFPYDPSETGVVELSSILPNGCEADLARLGAVAAWGARSAWYAARSAQGYPVPESHAVGLGEYGLFLEQSGLDVEIEAILDELDTSPGAAIRSARLAALRDAIFAAPLSSDLILEVTDHVATWPPGARTRISPSTNASRTVGYPLPTTLTGGLIIALDEERTVERAIREVFAGLWTDEAFLDRDARGIDSRGVGMGLLVHPTAESVVYGFSWLLEGELAGMARPDAGQSLEENARSMAEEGIDLLISLTISAPDATVLQAHGLERLHLPVPDFTAPTMEQMHVLVAAVDEVRLAGGTVGIHCGAGRGRTGTMLAVYLVHLGWAADDAIAEVRRLRPGSIETAAQEASVAEFQTLGG